MMLNGTLWRKPGLLRRVPASDERGTALITTLLIASLLMMFCFAFLTESNTATSFSTKQHARMSAFYAAEAGAQRAYVRLCSDLNWRDGFKNEPIGSGCYNVSIDDCLTDADLPPHGFRITSTGTTMNQHRTVRVTLKPPREKAFDYACFAMDTIELASSGSHGTEVWGHLYSSGNFRMDRRCTVYGDLVTTGDVSIGSRLINESPARFHGDILSRRSIQIAKACSVLARDTTISACALTVASDGNVTARQSIDCEGFIRGVKRSLSPVPVESIPFPEGFFDLPWPGNEMRKVRGWPLYTFSSPDKFRDFFERTYSRDTETFLLHGVFMVNGDIEIEVPRPSDKVIVLGTLVAFGDVKVSTPAPLMLQRADSTFPAIVALGTKCSGGDIVFGSNSGPVSVSGLVYAKGSIYLGDRYPENEICVTGGVCAHRIYSGSHCRIVYDPSIRLAMPFSSHSLLVDSWEEL